MQSFNILKKCKQRNYFYSDILNEIFVVSMFTICVIQLIACLLN